jgi:hypothetical protein
VLDCAEQKVRKEVGGPCEHKVPIDLASRVCGPATWPCLSLSRQADGTYGGCGEQSLLLVFEIDLTDMLDRKIELSPEDRPRIC